MEINTVFRTIDKLASFIVLFHIYIGFGLVFKCVRLGPLDLAISVNIAVLFGAYTIIIIINNKN